MMRCSCPPGFPQFNVILDLKHANIKQLDTRASLLIAEILQVREGEGVRVCREGSRGRGKGHRELSGGEEMKAERHSGGRR